MNYYDCYIDPQTGALPPQMVSGWVREEGITSIKKDTSTLLKFVENKREAWLRDGKCLSLRHDSQTIQSLAQEMYEELLGKIFLSPLESVSPEKVLLGLSRILISVRGRDEKPRGQKLKSKIKAKPSSRPDEKYLSQTLASGVTRSTKKTKDYGTKFLDSIAPEQTQNMSHEMFRQDLMESIRPKARWRARPECVIIRFILCNNIYRRPSKVAVNYLIQILKALANLKDQDSLSLYEEELLLEKTKSKISNTGSKLRNKSLLVLTDPTDEESELIRPDAFEKKWRAQRSEWESRSPWIAGLETLPDNGSEKESTSDINTRSVKKRGVKPTRKVMPAKRPKVDSLRPRNVRSNYLFSDLSDLDFYASEDFSDQISETENETEFSDYREDSLLQCHIICLKVPSRHLERILGKQTKVTEHITSPSPQQTGVSADPVTLRSSVTPPAVFHTHGANGLGDMYLAVSDIRTSDLATTRPDTPDAQSPIVISSDHSDLDEESGYDTEEDGLHRTLTSPRVRLPSLVIKTSCGNDKWTKGTSYPASVLYCTVSEFFDWIEDQYQTTPSHLDFVLDLEPRQYLKELMRSQDERFEVLKGCIKQNVEFVAHNNDEMFRIVMRLHE